MEPTMHDTSPTKRNWTVSLPEQWREVPVSIENLTLFAFFGYLLDKWLGTGPILLATLGGTVAIYEVWKLWYTYTQKMRTYEDSLPDAKGIDAK